MIKLPTLSYLVILTNDCFGEIGCLHNENHIVIDNSVPPTVNPPQRISITLKEMLKINIIVPIEEPTDWVNIMVIVEKPNGKLRICIDPRNLNKTIK